MNIESIEQSFESCVHEAGGSLRPSKPEEYSPIEVLGNSLRLPPLIQPPRIWIDSPRMYLGVHPWPTGDSHNLADDEFLAFPRYPLRGPLALMQAIDRGFAGVTDGPVREFGGTRRRLASRPEQLTAGSECTLPNLLLNASPLLAKPFHGVSIGLEQYESMAHVATENIAMYGLNHDRYISCEPSDLDRAVPAISDELERVLKDANVQCDVAHVGDARILRVTGEEGISRFWAPPTTEALVFPRRPGHTPRMPVSLYPGPEIDGWQISVARERPVGNPTLQPIKIMTGVVDDLGRWLNIGYVEFISTVGNPDDHRMGKVNDLQNLPVTWNGDGSYTKDFREGERFDSIPENFPNDPDRAYCTLMRMCSEQLAGVYVRQYKLEESAPPIEPMAQAIRSSTDLLMDIVTEARYVSPHKVVEGFQQLIVLHLNQPHAWASLANALNLGRMFPRAKLLWRALDEKPIPDDDQRPCTDGYISATVRMPEIWVDRSTATYKLDEPTAIDRVIEYAQRVVGIPIPEHLSALGKLAWLYEPIL